MRFISKQSLTHTSDETNKDEFLASLSVRREQQELTVLKYKAGNVWAKWVERVEHKG